MKRPSLPRLLALASCVALAGYAFVYTPGHGSHAATATAPVSTTTASAAGTAANSTAPAATPTPATMPTVFPPAGGTFLGVMTQDGPSNFAALDRFDTATKTEPQVLEFSQGWAVAPFERGTFDKVEARGMMPLVSWEPWNYTQAPSADKQRGIQAEYKLSNIIDGDFDAYITSWAEGVKSLEYPVGIRFAHEMNGYWYPWAEQTNGNSPGQYVRAWQHVHDIFTKVGATNAVWVWSPNVDYAGSTPLKELYPGDKYVDWIGLSGYYGTLGLQSYTSFNNIFDATFTDLKHFTDKPIVITETGAKNDEGLKASWIKQMFTELPSHPDIIGVVWYEAVKVFDWRISADPAAAAAWKIGAASPRFQAPWTPNTVPRLTTSTSPAATATNPTPLPPTASTP